MQFKEWLINENKHEYSCVLANLKSIKNSILDWSKKFVKDSMLYVGEKNTGRETKTHVTVLYGLHTCNFDEVKSIIEKFKPFEITFKTITKFESEKYDVLKIDIESKDLIKMNQALKKLPYTSNHPKYHAHCTIAYVKKGSCDHLINSEPFVGESVTIKEITFSSSDGQKTNINL